MACGAQKAAAPVAVAPMVIEGELARCQRAAQLREDGYSALSSLKLKAARSAYLQSLEFDPDNRGALVQLSVIDALAEDRQVGTSASNDHVYGSVQRSPCEKYAADKLAAARPAPGNVVKPTVEKNGQIVSYAKGAATRPSDLLTPVDIGEAMESAVKEFGRCYKRGVDRNPQLRGEMVLHLDVDPSGDVQEIQLRENTLYEHGVEMCISNVAGHLSFPRRKSHVTMSVIYPLMFGSTEDERIAAVASAKSKSRASR